MTNAKIQCPGEYILYDSDDNEILRFKGRHIRFKPLTVSVSTASRLRTKRK
jgi:hypothetical protein